MSSANHAQRKFVRSFFTSPTALSGEADSAKMLRRAIGLRGMEAPDVWVPDNEDATAPSMRDEGVENIIEVVENGGANFPGEIHPRVVWHRNKPETRKLGFDHMLRLANPDRGAIQHIDGFVIPEVGDIDDWKKADEAITLVEATNGLDEASLAMSVIVESAQAELALASLREEIAHPTNNLQRMYLLVDGEVDYTKDMRAMTATGELPAWPELRHNTSRGASAANLIAVDGPFDDIRDLAGYRARMTENRAKGMNGIWSLTPSQVVAANTDPLPPTESRWILSVGEQSTTLAENNGTHRYDGNLLTMERADGDQTAFTVDGETQYLGADELRETLLDMISYVPSMSDIVNSMEEFEAAKEAGTGAIVITRATTVVVDGIQIEIEQDRMWDEATYQAAQTPIALFQDVYRHRPDQHEALAARYEPSLLDRAVAVGSSE